MNSMDTNEEAAMKILLIAPASLGWHHVGTSRLFGGRTFRFSLLSLLSVAAETPAGDEVRLVDEQLDEIPWEGWDLVGISAMTAAAPRAYELAAGFRRRGVPVVMGGMHPTFVPEEALEHVDAVVVGDAEGVWPRVVEDARRGRMAGIYRAEVPPRLEGLRPPPRGLLPRGAYATVQAVQATRGCPKRCSFCSVIAFHDGGYRRRPVAEVASEIAALSGRFVIFVDDNLTADAAYARELFAALGPLRRHWMSQVTLAMADDRDLVARAADSGCVGVFVGLESFSVASLASVRKGWNRIDEYRRRIDCFHEHGIGVEAGIVMGLDGDGPDAFRRTLDLLEELAIDMVQVSVLTPLPGTPLDPALAGRIFDRDWSHYDYHHVVFEPARMSSKELQAGHDWLTREFYRPRRIARRLARLARRRHGLRTLPYAAAINLAYYGRVRRWGIRGWDPGRDPRAVAAVAPAAA